MFKKTIEQTLLTSDIASGVFPNINVNPWNGDVSFSATLRALAAPRMSSDDRIGLYHLSMRREREYYATPEDGFYALFSPGEPNSIQLANITSVNRDKWFESLEKDFESVFHGWHRIAKVTDFFVKAFKVLCFVNPDSRSTLLVTDCLDMRRFHYLQVGIPAYLPWYFDPKQGMTEQELALLNSLRQKTSDEYERCIAAIAEKYDFRAMRIRNGLVGFESVREKADIQCRMNDVTYYRDEVRRLNDVVTSYLTKIRDEETAIMGLQARIRQNEEADSPIMNYFLSNPRLVFESINDTVMTFGVRDYLTFFDEDHAKALIENEQSMLFEPNDRSCNNIIPVEDMQMLMRHVFLEQDLRIRMCAVFSLTMGGGVQARGEWNYSPEYDFYLPNPHLHCYSCLGQYSQHINACLVNGNYVGAVEQCVASCRSLNVDDYPVMQEFSRFMYGISEYPRINNTCIELPDGRVVNPKNAIKYLKGEETIG